MRLFAVLAVPLILAAFATSAHAQKRAEVGVGIGTPAAQHDHERGTNISGLIGARALWDREYGTLDVGLDVRPTTVSDTYYMGDARGASEAWILRTRITAGARYSLLHGPRHSLFARLALGVEHRMSRYQLYDNGDPPTRENTTEQSSGAIAEPSLGLRIGSERRYVVLELSAPTAYYSGLPITVHGEGDGMLEVDVLATVRVGWSL